MTKRFEEQINKLISRRVLYPTLVIALATQLACGLIDLARDILEGLGSRSTHTWYVSIDGDDRNACNAPEVACRTVKDVVRRSITDGDTIIIAAGTYLESLSAGESLEINNDLNLQGAGRELTIVDFTGSVNGFHIGSEVDVTMMDLTVQNVSRGDSAPFGGDCIGVEWPAKSLTLNNVTVQQCATNGLNVYDPANRIQIILKDVKIIEHGLSGIRQFWGILRVERSAINLNGNSGVYLYDVSLTLTNAYIEENQKHGIELWGGTADITDAHLLNNGGGPGGAFIGGRPELGSVAKAGLFIGESDMEPEVTVANSEFDGNVDGVTLAGGRHALLSISESKIMNHHRVGLRIISGNTDVDDVTFQHNGSAETIITPTEQAEAGGVWVNVNASLKLKNSRVLDNYGGVSVWGTRQFRGMADITSTVISNNSGNRVGGIFNKGIVTLLLSTIDKNQSASEFSGVRVGGIYNAGNMEIINSTVSGNTGAGILERPEYADVSDALTLRFVTVAQNEGHGIGVFSGVPLIVENSLIGLNGGAGCYFDTIARVARYATSMDSDRTCGGLTSAPDLLRLGPLADNGGPTQTHALLAGSPAIDAATGDCPAADQRGEVRPVGDGCDIGAYEYGQAAPATAPDALQQITPTPEQAQVTAIKNANCRYGPSTAYDIRDTLFEGQTARIVGRNEENTWWQVELPVSLKLCWVSYVTVEASGPLDVVEIGEAPPMLEVQLPEEQPIEPPVVPQGCYVYNKAKIPVCKIPCPPNAIPGGACTP